MVALDANLVRNGLRLVGKAGEWLYLWQKSKQHRTHLRQPERWSAGT